MHGVEPVVGIHPFGFASVLHHEGLMLVGLHSFGGHGRPFPGLGVHLKSEFAPVFGDHQAGLVANRIRRLGLNPEFNGRHPIGRFLFFISAAVEQRESRHNRKYPEGAAFHHDEFSLSIRDVEANRKQMACQDEEGVIIERNCRGFRIPGCCIVPRISLTTKSRSRINVLNVPTYPYNTF